MYLAKNVMKQVCGGVLKLSNFCSDVFSSIFRELEVDKEKYKYAWTLCGNAIPRIL